MLDNEYTPDRCLDEHLDERMDRDCFKTTCEVCRAFRGLAHYLVANDCNFAIDQITMFEHAIFLLEDGEASIRICRVEPRNNVVGTQRELIFLAHEAGHWRSYTDGQRHQGLDQATKVMRDDRSSLTAEQKHVLVDEEERAWRLGERLLRATAPDLDDAFWAKFNDEQQIQLSSYRELPLTSSRS